MFIPCLLWAADSPRVMVDQSPMGANKADLGFTSVINGDNHMDVVISSGSGQGCSAGQYWDIGVGGCTSEILLRTVSVTQGCSCDCGGGATGTCSAQQDGSYQVFGWRLPTAGNELVSRNGATNWGGCYTTSNSCVAIPTAPPSPPGAGPGFPGSTIKLISGDLVCDASNPVFSLGGGNITEKIRIINAYMSHPNNFGRCPEYTYAGYQGFFDWQGLLSRFSIDQIVVMIGTTVLPDSEVQKVVDAACNAGADAAFGAGTYVSSTFIRGSGNNCMVLF